MSSLKHIFFISQKMDDSLELLNSLKSNKNYDISSFEIQNDWQSLVSNALDFMIMDIPKLTEDVTKYVFPLRAKGFDKFILMLTTKWTQEQIESFELLNNILIETRTMPVQNLKQILDKAEMGKEVKTRTHPRYLTNAKSYIKRLTDSKSFECTILNISKGGAQVECKDGDFNIDELIKIVVQLSQINKSHELTGTVIWKKKIADRNIVGCKFVDGLEVYKKLLK